MVQVPEGRQIFTDLTVNQNLMAGAFLRKDKDGVKRDLDVVFDYFPRLERHRPVRRPAQRRRAADAGHQPRADGAAPDPHAGRALPGPGADHRQPDLPDPRPINRHGTAILLVEQNAYKALAIAHRGYLMTTGEIEREGTREELGRAENLYRIYLGKTSAEQEGP